MEDFTSLAVLGDNIEVGVRADGRLILRTTLIDESEPNDTGVVIFVLPSEASKLLLEVNGVDPDDFRSLCKQLGLQLLGFANLQLACLRLLLADISHGIGLFACLNEGMAGIGRQVQSMDQVRERALTATRREGLIRALLEASHLPL